MYFVRGISGSITRHWLKLNSWNLRSSWRELDIDPHWFHLNRLIKSLCGLGEQRFACQQPFIQSVQGRTRKPVVALPAWPPGHDLCDQTLGQVLKNFSGDWRNRSQVGQVWWILQIFPCGLWTSRSPKGPFSPCSCAEAPLASNFCRNLSNLFHGFFGTGSRLPSSGLLLRNSTSGPAQKKHQRSTLFFSYSFYYCAKHLLSFTCFISFLLTEFTSRYSNWICFANYKPLWFSKKSLEKRRGQVPQPPQPAEHFLLHWLEKLHHWRCARCALAGCAFAKWKTERLVNGYESRWIVELESWDE